LRPGTRSIAGLPTRDGLRGRMSSVHIVQDIRPCSSRCSVHHASHRGAVALVNSPSAAGKASSRLTLRYAQCRTDALIHLLPSSGDGVERVIENRIPMFHIGERSRAVRGRFWQVGLMRHGGAFYRVPPMVIPKPQPVAPCLPAMSMTANPVAVRGLAPQFFSARPISNETSRVQTVSGPRPDQQSASPRLSARPSLSTGLRDCRAARLGRHLGLDAICPARPVYQPRASTTAALLVMPTPAAITAG